MKNWLRPDSYERRYRRFLKKTNAAVKAEFLRRLGDIRLLKTRKQLEQEEGPLLDPEPTNTVERDSRDIDILIAGMLAWWSTRTPSINLTITGYFDAVNGFNDNQFRLVVKDLTRLTIPSSIHVAFQPGQTISPLADMLLKLGDKADIYRQEPYMNGLKTNWQKVQTVYVDKTIVNEIKDLELILRDAMVSQAAKDAVTVMIDKKTNTVDNRLDQFGRQQINDLDVQLSEERQKSIGVEEYEWMTQLDERVRGRPDGLYPNAVPSHWARQGKIFNWNRPPEGGHPGEAPGCRCRAIMRLPR